MKILQKIPPRTFSVNGHEIHDHGQIILKDGELITLVTPEGRSCDIVARSWGFYLGGSLNSRLKKEGFKTALVLNEAGQIYVNAVDESAVDNFLDYLRTNQSNTLLCWLDEWIPSGGLSNAERDEEIDS